MYVYIYILYEHDRNLMTILYGLLNLKKIQFWVKYRYSNNYDGQWIKIKYYLFTIGNYDMKIMDYLNVVVNAFPVLHFILLLAIVLVYTIRISDYCIAISKKDIKLNPII